MPSAIFKRNLESINVELSDKQIEQLDKYYEILVDVEGKSTNYEQTHIVLDLLPLV